MAINTRQNSLLVAENWKKIYQTFQEADFTSYDFETLRKSMIDYIKLYYPEDFNDFTESSEFIALIDLIAFMGQALAFRTDLNARENFIDTAERRDSILKLARLISYNPKRNISSSGLLKIENVTTTETLYDSNGFNLSNLSVNWNDLSNDNWLEQFTTIVNAALISSQVIGKPGNTQTINNVRTEEYGLNLIPNVLGVYKFQSAIEGNNFDFEIVSPTSIAKSYIYERTPSKNAPFNILYRNDNYGNASNDTGFFVYFKQGALASQDFTLSDSIPNRVVNFNFSNINNTDVWLYSLDSNGELKDLWTQVPAVGGVNVIYNKSQERNLYQVNTKANDQIDLVFGDGSFANIPTGSYRLYYRTSAGIGYKITPDEMKGVAISFNYVSRDNRIETINLRASLQYTVTNASSRETTADIKQKAPQQYYTQNRMITGEDYNILPYTTFGNVLKAKSVNRTSSGVSRYLDVIDPTAKYSSTNIFCSDGILYQDNYIRAFKFSANSSGEISKVINDNIVKDIILSQELQHFYYANYPRFPGNNTASVLKNINWNLTTFGSNTATGYFVLNKTPAVIGGVAKNETRYLRQGAIIKFVPKAGYYFDTSNNMIPGTAPIGSNDNIYACVTTVYGNGTNNGIGNLDDGTGPVILNVKVPTGAVIAEVIPVFKNGFTSFYNDSITGLIKSFKNFGLTFDVEKQIWKIISSENLNTSGQFSLTNQNDISGTGIDASWLIRFEYNLDGYIVYYRGIEYTFESAGQTGFFFDDRIKVYDTKSGSIINDQVTVLKTNRQPDSNLPLAQDCSWKIYKNSVGSDGYVDKNKIYVTFADSNSDGIPDNPDLFKLVVDPTVNSATKFVYFQLEAGYQRFQNLIPLDNKTIVSLYATANDIIGVNNLYLSGQQFYAYGENAFYQLNSDRTLTEITDYTAKIGRQELQFQYRHNSPDYRRINPSNTNVIDLYILTSAYEGAYRAWIQDTSGTIEQPYIPTTENLNDEFSKLNDIKSISDTIVFQSAKFKPIFGYKANNSLQATFKVVKNPSISISDNDIKTSVINAINSYFDITNWDFGETFYFSELSAYLHRALSPNVASIIIVPADAGTSFGTLYQINCEPHEIIVSAATVENVEVITSLTANQLNLSVASLNKEILI